MFGPLKSLALTTDTLIQFSKLAGMHMSVAYVYMTIRVYVHICECVFVYLCYLHFPTLTLTYIFYNRAYNRCV